MPLTSKNKLEAVILAGGRGTRLQSVIADRPKVLAPVAGKPFLHLLLNNLARNGFSRVVLSVGYMADQIIQAVGKTFANMEIHYVREAHPLGTGGGLRLAFQACKNDHVFVMNGDTFLNLDFARAEAFWQDHKDIILVGCKVEDSARYGCLRIDNNHITAFLEKSLSGPGVINAGCYIALPSSLDSFPPGKAFSFEKDVLQPFVAKKPIRLFITDGTFIDIGIPDDYARAQTVLRDFL